MLHQPVLLEKILSFTQQLNPLPKNIVDGTFGRGGHALALLSSIPNSRLLGFDRDEEAVAFGNREFSGWIENKKLKLVKKNFKDIPDHLIQFPEFFEAHKPDLILLDLGVSSPQLDNAERGFSFYHKGPLDMRMDQSQELTAQEIINTWTEKELSDLFYHLGEIRFPNKVVRAIAKRRALEPIVDTDELSQLIIGCEGWRKKGKHPATQYFLALRLRVNEELDVIQETIPKLIDALAPSGHLMVITFHSTEDRIVKNLFKAQSDKGLIITKKVIQAEGPEISENPRARSAKLRIFHKG